MPSETVTGTSGGMRRFLYALKVQRRVVVALILREIVTRYGRSNIGFLWLFVEPMLFTLAITALWTATRTVHGSDLPIVAFALTGYAAMLLWRSMPGRCMGAVESNRSLLFHRQVRILDVYISRILLEFAATSSSFVLLGIAFWACGWLLPPEDVLEVVGGWLLLAWFGMGLGFALGGLSEKVDLIQKFWPPFSYLLFPLSGAAFIADALPPSARELVLWLPMLNCVEIIREGYFGTKMTAHYYLDYVLIFNLLLTITGLSLVRQIGMNTSSQ